VVACEELVRDTGRAFERRHDGEIQLILEDHVGQHAGVGLDDMDFITYFETSKLEDFHSLILALEKVKEFQYTRRFGHPIWLGTARGLDEIIEILAQ